MTDPKLRAAAMSAVGAMSVAVHQIDHGRPPSEVRDTLVAGLNAQFTLRLQICAKGVHPEWWAEADPDAPVLECPWCDKAQLEDVVLNLADRPVWDLSGAKHLPAPSVRGEAS